MKKWYFSQGVVSATLLLVIASTAAKLIGLMREILVAKYYGASSTYDLYLISLAIPTLLASSLSYTLPNQIIPTFLNLRSQIGEAHAWRDIWKLGNLWALGTFVTSASLIIFAPGLVNLLAPNLSLIEQAEAIHLLRILAFIVFISYLGTFWESLLNAERNFFLSAIAPILYSLTLISTFFLLNNLLGIRALAYSILISTFARSIIMIVVLIQHRVYYAFNFDFKLPLLLPIMRSVGYIFAIEALSQALSIVDRIIASWYELPAGSISSLNYALMIYGLPIAVIALSLVQAIFPLLADYTAKQDIDGMVTTLSSCIRLLIFVLFPVAVLLIVLSKPIIILFYQRGAFDRQAVDMTAVCLSYLGMGILATSVGGLLMRVFYSLNLSKALLRSMVILFVLKIVITLSVAKLFSYGGLALSTTITWYVATLLLGYMLYIHIGTIDASRILHTYIYTNIAGLVAGMVCFLISSHLLLQNTPSLIMMTGKLIGIGGVTCLVYFVVSLVLRMEEPAYLIKTVSSMFSKTRAAFQF